MSEVPGRDAGFFLWMLEVTGRVVDIFSLVPEVLGRVVHSPWDTGMERKIDFFT